MAAPNRRSLLPYQIVFGVTSAALGGIIAVLGELRDQLGFSGTGIGIIVTAGFLASFVAQITLAPLADRGHGRRMAVVGIAISGAALFVMALADGVTTWALARAALGVAAGLLLPGIRRAATVLDPERAGENLGRLVVGEVLGFVTGPIVAAVLVEVGGIRAPFLVFGIGMVIFLPFVARLPEDRGRQSGRRQSFDLLRHRRLQGALILILGYFLLLGAFEAVLPVMLTDRGGGPLEAGIAFSLFGIPIILVSARAGRAADRLGGVKVATIGMAVSATVTMSYGILPGVWPLIIVLTLNGLADGYGFTAGQVAVSRAVPEERQAGALGLMGATEVFGAGVAALPAAIAYENVGAGPTWIGAGLASLALLGLGTLRLRGTSPITPEAGPLDWTPVDRHPTPSDGG